MQRCGVRPELEDDGRRFLELPLDCEAVHREAVRAKVCAAEVDDGRLGVPHAEDIVRHRDLVRVACDRRVEEVAQRGEDDRRGRHGAALVHEEGLERGGVAVQQLGHEQVQAGVVTGRGAGEEPLADELQVAAHLVPVKGGRLLRQRLRAGADALHQQVLQPRSAAVRAGGRRLEGAHLPRR